MAVLELDRVLDASPDELDRHRLGLKAVRGDRLELISESTAGLLARMITAAGAANSKVLLNPIESAALIKSSNLVAIDVRSSEATRWVDAADERWDKLRRREQRGLIPSGTSATRPAARPDR
jgi:hypothetical protein